MKDNVVAPMKLSTEDSLPKESYRINDERSGSDRMRHFMFILFGQVISVFGSTLTSFSLGVWAFQQTASVTAYTSIFFAVSLGTVLTSPFAGALVDRWNKKKVLIIGTLISASVSSVIAILFLLDTLAIWAMVLCAAVNGIATAFSQPAITSSVKSLIDPDDLGRANGIMASGFGFMTLLAPMVAGYLLIKIDLIGILFIDLFTFVIGILVLSFLKLPIRALTPDEPIFKSLTFAWQYLKTRSALILLMAFLFTTNLVGAFVLVLVQPLLLTLTDASGLGNILTISGIGYLAGAVLMGSWGGPERKIYAVYLSALMVGLGLFILPMTTNIVLFSAGTFLLAFGLPIGMTCNQAIIQRKVSGQYIGRVDGLGKLLIGLAMPIGFLLAGPIAEYIFEPFMAKAHGSNAYLVNVYGVGQGRGIALMLSMIAIVLLLVVFLAALNPSLRRVELDLEDEV